MAEAYTIDLIIEDGCVVAEVRELSGCMVVGETVSEAMEKIQEAIEYWERVLAQYGTMAGPRMVS